MALSTKTGSFSLNASTGNQSVTGVGFQPKVVIFFYNPATADGNSGNATLGIGVGIPFSSRAIDCKSIEGGASSVNTAANQNTACIYFAGANPIADMSSLDADGFTINLSAASTAAVINYLALGGSDLTNVKTGACTAKTSTGNQAYTGVGFQPDCLIFFAGKYSTPETFDTNTNGAYMLGMVTSSSDRGYVAWRSRNGSNPSVVKHRQSVTKAGVSLTDAGVFTEFDFVSFDSDGFTLNFTTAGGTADIVYYLALKGGRYKVSSFTQPGSTGNQAITGIGFSPKACLVMSANDTSANNDATNNGLGLSFGSATGTSARGCLWAGDTHNVSPIVAKSNLDRTKVIKMITVGATPTVNAAADHVSFDSDGQTINWTTADATARQSLVLYMGDTATDSKLHIPQPLFLAA